ncbi:patatin-like phospholipase family protein [Microbulbifer sp. GL-2]|uniref:patatin-like phospholipase family protein n=1 Tax=Microbulbifer sp. GL-2 TaxID=2591606 RepID=UPI001164B1FA|nr:patatin-like phospholipase family protein [Microbulbifer sp. GL-2]BBM03187.1 patatin [Microbulbifer sp. GL-2]
MFDQVVFAGGGVRCTWQIGFWDAVASEIQLSPRVVSAVSAGALVSSLILMGKSLAAVDHFATAFRTNGRNIHWQNLFKGKPVFPHHHIYRHAMRKLFTGGLKKLHSTADLRIAVAYSPEWLSGPLALLLGIGIDYTDTYFSRSLHPSSARRLGYRQFFHSAHNCTDELELERLILTSSCTPPLTPRQQREGAEILDGGVVDSVPVGGLDPEPGRVLILLTRNYPQYPWCFTCRKGDQLWTYVQPIRPLPIRVWDFANPQALTRVFHAGRADGQAFLAMLLAGEHC